MGEEVTTLFDADHDLMLWWLILQTRQLMYKTRTKELRQYGITPQESQVLWVVKGLGYGPTPAEIARLPLREPHDEEQEIDFRRLHNWLGYFEIRNFRLPLEFDDEWRIPEDEKGLHTSGHACGLDLLNIAREIKPKVLIPVHSEYPNFYTECLQGGGINVILPTLGGTIEI